MKMIFLRIPKYWRAICSLLLLILFQAWVMGCDPWKAMQNRFEDIGVIQVEKQQISAQDPWKRLRDIFLIFSKKEKIVALTNPKVARKISRHLHRALKPHARHIYKASHHFNIPQEIIKAVIVVESGGDPRAKAKTSSAKGLMQTIDSTFKAARKDLLVKGIYTAATPYDAHASIMAGSWYLDRMFRQAAADKKPGVKKRNDLESWRLPLQYYYAGPIIGRKPKDIAVMYARGKRVVINKPAYSKKVIKWARIMATD